MVQPTDEHTLLLKSRFAATKTEEIVEVEFRSSALDLLRAIYLLRKFICPFCDSLKLCALHFCVSLLCGIRKGSKDRNDRTDRTERTKRMDRTHRTD